MASSTYPFSRAVPCFAALVAFSLPFAGCKSTGAPVDDAALTAAIQKQLSADSAIANQPIQTVVASGVATLSGTVGNDAQRTLAARDAASIPGVKEVINQISFASAQTTAPPFSNLAPPTPPAVHPSAVRPQPLRDPAPIERRNDPARHDNERRDNGQQTYTPPPAPQPVVQLPPPAPAPPVFRSVTVPSGNAIAVRITQTLDSATTQPGTSFSGVVASDVLVDGLVAIPAGSAVSGNVDAVQEAAHFKGSSLLTVSLGSISRRGDRIAVTTEPYTVAGKGRGVNTAEKAGGGAAVGAILGGIFGGGKGAAIGAAAGGGVGAGANAVTRGQQVQIASESVVRFRLTNPITIRVRTDGEQEVRGDGLDRHRNNQH